MSRKLRVWNRTKGIVLAGVGGGGRYKIFGHKSKHLPTQIVLNRERKVNPTFSCGMGGTGGP